MIVTKISKVMIWYPNIILSVMDKTTAATAKLLQSCPALCNPIDSSPPGSPVPGIQEHWSGLTFPSPMHASEK